MASERELLCFDGLVALNRFSNYPILRIQYELTFLSTVPVPVQ